MSSINSQTTKTEIQGLGWFFHRKDVAKSISWWRIYPELVEVGALPEDFARLENAPQRG